MSTTLCLIRQDPAVGGFLRAVLTCLGTGFLFRVVPDLGQDFGRLAADDLPGGFVPFYLLLTGMAATFVLAANSWTRSSRLALGLPLSSRLVWTVRILMLMAVGLVSVAAFAATMGLTVNLAAWNVTMNQVITLAAARAAVTVVLMLCLFQLPQSERDRIPIDAPYVVYLVLAGVATLLLSAINITSAVGTLFLLSVALFLGAWLYFRVPSSFSVGPTLAESLAPAWLPPHEPVLSDAKPARYEDAVDDRKVRVPVLHRVLFRGLRTNILTWFFLFVIGASAGVVTAEFFGGTNAILPFFFLAIYFLPALQASIEAMSSYDSLPISRRLLWLHAVGPIMFSAALGAGVSLMVFWLNPYPFTQIRYSDCCSTAPWEYLKLSRDGNVPTVTSAWGESLTPTTYALWLGRSTVIYDPYEIGLESSQRFRELQLRRAVEEVYGAVVSETSVGRDQPQATHGGGDRESIIDATRGRISVDRFRTAAVALFLLNILGTVLVLMALLQYSPFVYRKVFKWALRCVLVLFGVAVIALSIARLAGFTEIWYAGAVASIYARSFSQWLPLPTWALWFVCSASWVGAYLLLERAFSFIELPREKTMNRFAEEY